MSSWESWPPLPKDKSVNNWWNKPDQVSASMKTKLPKLRSASREKKTTYGSIHQWKEKTAFEPAWNSTMHTWQSISEKKKPKHSARYKSIEPQPPKWEIRMVMKEPSPKPAKSSSRSPANTSPKPTWKSPWKSVVAVVQKKSFWKPDKATWKPEQTVPMGGNVW